VVVVVILACLVGARLLAPAFGDGDPLVDCPTGRPAAAVSRFSQVVVSPSDPLAAGLPLYQLDVDFEVTNEASEAVVVQGIEAGVIGHGDATVVAMPADGRALQPGETATYSGSGFVSGATTPPVPESAGVRLEASWADDAFLHCDI